TPSASFTRDWTIRSSVPDRAGRAAYAADPNANQACLTTKDQSGVQYLDTPAITVPATPGPKLTFEHYVATEAGWDGGNVQFSLNGGAWTLVPAAAFVYNPYNSSLFTVVQGNSDPIAGQAAFTGSDPGSNGGTWGRSIIDLTNPGIGAVAGNTIRFRF